MLKDGLENVPSLENICQDVEGLIFHSVKKKKDKDGNIIVLKRDSIRAGEMLQMLGMCTALQRILVGFLSVTWGGSDSKPSGSPAPWKKMPSPGLPE